MAKTPKSGSSDRARQRSRQQAASRSGGQRQRGGGAADPARSANPQAGAAADAGSQAATEPGGTADSSTQPATTSDSRPETRPDTKPAASKPAATSGTRKQPSPRRDDGPRPFSQDRAIDRARTGSKSGGGKSGRPPGGGKAGGSRPSGGKPVKGPSARRKAEQRRRRLTLLYTLLTVGVVAVLVAVIVVDRRSDNPAAESEAFQEAQASLASAREAAGCTEVQSFEQAGRDHINASEQPSNWNVSPPHSGDHLAQWLQPGFYEEPQDERMAVHSLEHGYVVVQYKNLAEDQIAQLRDLQASHEGEKFIVQPYDGLEQDGVALSAWQHTQTCEQVNLEVINGFVDAFMLPGGSQSVAPEPMAG